MNKELEAFERIKTEGDIEGNELHFFMDEDDINIVENGLKRLESIDNANPSEALECLETICRVMKDYTNMDIKWVFKNDYNTIKEALLKAQANARSEEILQKYYQEGITLDSVRELKKENQKLLQAAALFKQKLEDTDNIKVATTMMKQLDTNIKLEKENEILKEIIKSFFDRGCPLHQYIDKKGVLQIEVDNDCSIMRLGEFKGVDLDKKLKEVLELI